ncbi:putative LysR family transcriptional regulator [Arthrobacter globiformis NBRC 12137]|uniref:Putative LysR family transcriptional regulator n=1 Tax=Arthrobacter globiformis (strain ATCC 8010 / DSM 20124 / JCM 1332 / NBRC 12137 / NCIMB 8907 / NRRL B-2979 / 168) TaxID=1077972 RepID=H0QLT4_ARTG1|nr:LysR family transcriptional regulator [Arthrobacter globiformis]GAB13785.1 putative LysR family transcriptional regulator [Arthrobacter globiformis NBRC 12137]
MEISQLEIFLAVAETGSITKAANKLLRAPSNVSTRIQQLERELGVKLLVRDKRQSSLSADGEIFREHAQKIIDMCNDAKAFTAKGEPRGKFRLGALESTAAVRIPPILASFHLRYPAVDVELEAGSSGVLFDHLLNGQLTAAFSDGKPAVPSLTGIRAFAEDLVILTPQTVTEINDDFKASHPTAFMFGTICSYRQRFEDWLESQGMVPGRIVEISSYYSMLACVAAGGGICMIPKSLLETLPGASRVQVHEIEGSLGTAETWLMWRRDCRSANLKAFITELKEHLNTAEQTVSAAA